MRLIGMTYTYWGVLRSSVARFHLATVIALPARDCIENVMIMTSMRQ